MLWVVCVPLAVGGAMSVAVNAHRSIGAARARGHRPTCADDDAPRTARALAWLSIFTIECSALLRAMLTPPYGAESPALGRGRRPVVLLHDRGLHRGSLGSLARRLRRDGYDAHVVRYGPLRGLEASVARAATAVARVRAAAGADAVDVIAHGA